LDQEEDVKDTWDAESSGEDEEEGMIQLHWFYSLQKQLLLRRLKNSRDECRKEYFMSCFQHQYHGSYTNLVWTSPALFSVGSWISNFIMPYVFGGGNKDGNQMKCVQCLLCNLLATGAGQ
jgi:hypothetical protein